MHPTVSIITVNFNNKEGLIQTLNSIQQQTYTDYEHIIIDAESTDGSKEIIQKYETANPRLKYWVSEPDKGIYDGMNKGIDHVKGEYIYFLNSGDYLHSEEALSSVIFDGTQYICGNLSIEHSNNIYENIIPPSSVDAIFLLKSFLPHPASFIHNSLFTNYRYRTDYRIISDWIHMMESIIFKGCSYKHINTYISIFNNTGISSQNGNIGQTERNKWIKEHISLSIYNTLMEFDALRQSELGRIIPTIMKKKHKNQKKIRKIALFFSSFFK